jgi:hypothetical protein
MESYSFRELGSSRDSASKRLEALLDKLVAVQIDLEPVCAISTARARAVVSLQLIDGACEILRSAVEDVRNIIHQVDVCGQSLAFAAHLRACEPWPLASLQA